jgi:hypothetical protein
MHAVQDASHGHARGTVQDVSISLRNTAIDKCRQAIMELMGQQAGKDWFKAMSEQVTEAETP